MNLSTRNRLFAFLLLAFFFSQAVFPQAKDQNASRAVPLTVRINVTVTDASGQQITNLTQDRFRVFENDVPQTITAVEQRNRPLVFGLAIDATGSMRAQFGKAIGIAKRFVADMRPDDSMFLLRFVSSDNIGIEQGLTSNKSALENALSGMYVEGGLSAIVDAVYRANEYLTKESSSEVGARRALVLLTDGEDRNSFYKQEQLFTKLRESGVQVFVIALAGKLQGYPNKAENFIRRLALETGGIVYRPPDFEQAVAAIMVELRAPYVINYNSANPARDGKTRMVRVEVVDQPAEQKFSIVARQSYSPPNN